MFMNHYFAFKESLCSNSQIWPYRGYMETQDISTQVCLKSFDVSFWELFSFLVKFQDMNPIGRAKTWKFAFNLEATHV